MTAAVDIDAGRVAVVTVPVRTVSEANNRDHWSKKHARASEQRLKAFAFLRRAPTPQLRPPCVVRLTRIGTTTKKLDDDNLRSALKACRDGVADWLKIDDGSDLVTWEYGQEKGKVYAVRIEVRCR